MLRISFLASVLAVCLGSGSDGPGIVQLKSNGITRVPTDGSWPEGRDPEGGAGRRRRRSAFDEPTRRQLVDKHNELRRLPPASDMELLVWNDELASLAEGWAELCRWEHGQPSRPAGPPPFDKVGQNLYSSNGTPFDPVGAVQLWYDEVRYYDYDTGRCSTPPCGHYTQVVWSTSREVGCAYAHCPYMLGSGMTNANYVVCNYGPTGNYVGLKPYRRGEPCTACQSGRYWCDRGLCRADCTRQSTKCTCEAGCRNCGRVVRRDCSCRCADGFHGPTCSERCLDTHEYCGANPGWPVDWCNVTYVRERCPDLCGLCVRWTPERERRCRDQQTPSATSSVLSSFQSDPDSHSSDVRAPTNAGAVTLTPTRKGVTSVNAMTSTPSTVVTTNVDKLRTANSGNGITYQKGLIIIIILFSSCIRILSFP